MSAQKIDINILADVATETASGLLMVSAECITAMLEALPADQAETMGKRPMLVAVHALLQHLDCRAKERQQQQAAMIEALQDIRESIDFIAARPDDKTTLSVLAIEPEFIVAALKAAWLKTYPNHTEKEYVETMRSIEILAGL